MLTAIPKHWFTWDFTVHEGSQAIAEIDVSWWREKGTLTIQGQDYRVYREGVMSGYFVLESAGSVLARAEKPSAFRRTFLVEHAGRQYTLQAKSAWRRAFVLLQGSEEVGGIAPLGIFSRRASVDFPESLPLPVRVFLLWLAVLLWKREADSAAASGG
jgi:hypothetical protein